MQNQECGNTYIKFVNINEDENISLSLFLLIMSNVMKKFKKNSKLILSILFYFSISKEVWIEALLV